MSDQKVTYSVVVDGQEFRVSINEIAGRICYVSVDGGPLKEANLSVAGGPSRYSLLLDNQSFDCLIEIERDTYWIWIEGESLELQMIDQRLKTLGRSRQPLEKGQEVDLKTPMPGVVVSVDTSTGAKVKKGQGLITLESMKMRNEIKSPRDGKIKEICVKRGNTVAKGDILVRFETLPASLS